MRCRDDWPNLVSDHGLVPRWPRADGLEAIGRDDFASVELNEFAIDDHAVQQVALAVAVVRVNPQRRDGLGGGLGNRVWKLRRFRLARQDSAFDNVAVGDQQRARAAQASALGQQCPGVVLHA